MRQIRLTPLIHRNKECIGIYFDRDSGLEQIIRLQPEVKWSKTHHCWYIPLSETAFRLLKKDLEAKAEVDVAA